MNIPRPVFPKEHGLWAWVLLPVCVGGAVAEGETGTFALVLAAMFFGLLSFTPARMVYKSRKKETGNNRQAFFWSVAYFLPACLAAGAAVIRNTDLAPYFLLFGLGFYLGVRGSFAGVQRNAAFEFGGIFLLSVGSFLGSFSVAGKTEAVQTAVWALTLIFLADRSLQTRNIVRARAYLDEPKTYESDLRLVYRINIFLSFVSFAAVSAVTNGFGLHGAFLLPFLPGFFVTLYFFFRLPSSLKTVGRAEAVLVVVFGFAFVMMFNRFAL